MWCDVFKGGMVLPLLAPKLSLQGFAPHTELQQAPRLGNLSWPLVMAPCAGKSSRPLSRHLTLPPLRGTFVLAPHLTTRWRDDPTTSQSDQPIPKATPKLRPKTNRANSDADPNIDLDPDLDSASDSDSDSEYSESDATAEARHLTTRHILMPTQTPT